eukprot:CAMPEP_0198683854 /NCGR_PEP_ID=MMETSP1468-20131203/11307_1 /TAXON_ID=1461545 /ORGANISM="Mantoniella sp, Strain CCMP1436" /LENGTH=59 /DNA_ID=CAMNT_0044428215 /DNA_START=722 /DNA_END=898 /DNA_ORIENTATION=+
MPRDAAEGDAVWIHRRGEADGGYLAPVAPLCEKGDDERLQENRRNQPASSHYLAPPFTL